MKKYFLSCCMADNRKMELHLDSKEELKGAMGCIFKAASAGMTISGLTTIKMV